uniref:Toll-like receptor 9 n=1 Tax=Bombyx mori TaxID=7091 RepID=H9JNW2_BOMMO|nr:Toll-like receptor 9 [Bombyx mori]
MILKIIKLLKFFLLFIASAETRKTQKCLTGYMTDVQTWVNEDGVLTKTIDQSTAIDLSSHFDPVPFLHQIMSEFKTDNGQRVRYLSLAKCRLTRVPPVFHLSDSMGRWLSQTVEYMTFYGNKFVDRSVAGEQYNMIINATGAVETEPVFSLQYQGTTVWSTSIEYVSFPSLKELDLRRCSIQVLRSNMFRGMPSLEALYIGENEIYQVESNTFAGLNKLLHLDFSRNEAFDSTGSPKNLITPQTPLFDGLTSLVSLDLSFTKMSKRNVAVLTGLGPNLRRLSICDTGLQDLRSDIFSKTNLTYLDLSENNGILNTPNILRGLEDTLVVLYANTIGTGRVDMLKNFHRLEILQLLNNEITSLPQEVAATWRSLQILDLNKNRIITWFEPIFSLIPNLKFLALKHNNINVIREDMIVDFRNISYLALAGNFFMCNCNSRDFLETAARNERNRQNGYIKSVYESKNLFLYHRGFEDFNTLIAQRKPVVFENSISEWDNEEESVYLLTDFYGRNYICASFASDEGEAIFMGDVPTCYARRDMQYDEKMIKNQYKLIALILLPCVLLPLLMLFVFRRTIFYFLIMMRNSAALTMINKDKTGVDGTIFNYDVFVSYCNEDRVWVLDHLLPQLESNCNISVCLHERDFQIGLSILENIVACMDRSRAIMLIISKRFLMSQWCQFEMHLAQHRLLETRRNDLILVLLEEIPRRIRPTTLHYLMLTKTYIIWPKVAHERNIFWRRLRKGLVTQKLKHTENVSLA